MNFFYLGTNDLPRISCANHKLNLAVRSAMVKHKEICVDLKELNKFISSIRFSYNLGREFENIEARLRCENATRWGSQYLCLEALKKVLFYNIILVFPKYFIKTIFI